MPMPPVLNDAPQVPKNQLADESSHAMGLLSEFLNALPNPTFVVNESRQILAGNDSALREVGCLSLAQILGDRIGEVTQCIHAHNHPGGCGASEACRLCGSTGAVLESQRHHTKVQREARLTRASDSNTESLDYLVTATPIRLGGKDGYTLVSILDISAEKRRHALERIFFHDVLNTAGTLQGIVDYMRTDPNSPDTPEMMQLLKGLSDQLLTEIQGQRDLVAAERHELRPLVRPLQALLLLQSTVAQFSGHGAAQGKTLLVAPDAVDAVVQTDASLLRRVLLNMLKNAAEASEPGQVVTASCRVENQAIHFSVHNEAVMPPEVQLQVFQRSFSTKRSDRGLGTYSMKLITEQYLNGRISFTSAEGEGTTFTVSLPL